MPVMFYQEVLDYLQALMPATTRPSIERIAAYFAALNDPQDDIAAVHVGGTNGKGSVTTMIASMLTASGLVTGKFTGPHLVSFNERFELDGRRISDEEFAAVASLVHERGGDLSWFEFLTAMAVEWFGESQADAAVYEVGLGGRFDATNLLSRPVVAVITNVELDHVHLLGDTRAKIASEKAGIIKPGRPLVTACQDEALDVVRKRARELDSPLIVLTGGDSELKLSYERVGSDLASALSKLASELGGGVPPCGLVGAYQRINVLTALTAATVFDHELSRVVDVAVYLDALKSSRWDGRFQICGATIIDGAHNEAGARALRRSLDELYPASRFAFVFACFENKDYKSILSSLIRPGDFVAAPRFSHRRQTRFSSEICQYARSLGASAEEAADYGEAASLADNKVAEGGGFAPRKVVAGTFVLVKEALALQ